MKNKKIDIACLFIGFIIGALIPILTNIYTNGGIVTLNMSIPDWYLIFIRNSLTATILLLNFSLVIKRFLTFIFGLTCGFTILILSLFSDGSINVLYLLFEIGGVIYIILNNYQLSKFKILIPYVLIFLGALLEGGLN